MTRVFDPAVPTGGDSPAATLRRCRPGLEIRTLEPLGQGDFCTAVLLNGDTVVRIPRHARAAVALATEARLLPRIAPLLPVAIPVPEYVECADAPGAALALHRLIEGDGLTRSSWLSSPHVGRGRLARGVGTFLRSLHEVDVELARSSGVEGLDPRGQAQGLLRELDGAAPALPARLRDAIAAALDRFLAGGPEWSYAPAVLHCDVAPGHVRVDAARGEITGVIDWGDVAIGDPARDFIFLYEDFGDDFLALAVAAYEPPSTPRFLRRVYMQYILDQLEWTLRQRVEGRSDGFARGAAALERALRDLAGAEADGAERGAGA